MPREAKPMLRTAVLIDNGPKAGERFDHLYATLYNIGVDVVWEWSTTAINHLYLVAGATNTIVVLGAPSYLKDDTQRSFRETLEACGFMESHILELAPEESLRSMELRIRAAIGRTLSS